MKRVVLVVGVFAAVASVASTDVRPQRRALGPQQAPLARAVASSATCDGALRTELALAAIATAP